MTEAPKPKPFVPRDGALKSKTDTGEVVCANPGDHMFSTVSMFATHFFEDGHWRKIEGLD